MYGKKNVHLPYYNVILFSTCTCLYVPLRVYNCLKKNLICCCFIGCEDKTSSWHLNGFPDGIKIRVVIIIIYDNSAIEPYDSGGLGQQ